MILAKTQIPDFIIPIMIMALYVFSLLQKASKRSKQKAAAKQKPRQRAASGYQSAAQPFSIDIPVANEPATIEESYTVIPDFREPARNEYIPAVPEEGIRATDDTPAEMAPTPRPQLSPGKRRLRQAIVLGEILNRKRN